MEALKQKEKKTEAVEHDLVCDPRGHLIRKKGKVLLLTPTEYNILVYLIKKPGEFVPFEQLYEEVWHQPSLGNLKSLFVHMKNLRKKLGDDAASPKYILTRNRQGYEYIG